MIGGKLGGLSALDILVSTEGVNVRGGILDAALTVKVSQERTLQEQDINRGPPARRPATQYCSESPDVNYSQAGHSR